MSRSAPPRDAASVIAQEFLVDDPCSVSIDLPGAHTRLRPGPEKDRIEVNVSVVGCGPERAENILDRMQVGTHQLQDTVRLYSDADRDRSDAEWWRWVRTLDVTIHADLRIPSRVDADIRVPGGEVDLANLTGHVDVQAIGGPCRAENLEGTLKIQAESSDVSVHGFSGDQLDARVTVGSLGVEDVEAETVAARTAAAPLALTSVRGTTTVTARSAPVDLQDVNGPCTAHVEGGTLTYEGTPTGEIQLRGAGVSIDARLPHSHDADLAMTGATLSLADAFAFEGERTDQEIEGRLNDGGPPFQMHVTGGGTARCHPA